MELLSFVYKLKLGKYVETSIIFKISYLSTMNVYGTCMLEGAGGEEGSGELEGNILNTKCTYM